MFHDKRIHGKHAKVPKRQAGQFMLKGARKINIWQHLPKPVLGTVADDWKATGDSLRCAMRQYHASCD